MDDISNYETGMTIWRTLHKDMERAGFPQDKITLYKQAVMSNNGYILNVFKQDSITKNKLRNFLKKTPKKKKTMTDLEFKIKFCDGWLLEHKWYGKDYIKLLHSLGTPIYFTEELLLQCTGNYSVTKHIHTELKQMSKTSSGKRKADKIKQLMVTLQYEEIKPFFPNIQINFLDSITFEDLNELQGTHQPPQTLKPRPHHQPPQHHHHHQTQQHHHHLQHQQHHQPQEQLFEWFVGDQNIEEETISNDIRDFNNNTDFSNTIYTNFDDFDDIPLWEY